MDLASSLAAAISRHGDATAVTTSRGDLTYRDLSNLISRVEGDVRRAARVSDAGMRILVTSKKSAATIATYVACLLNRWVYVPLNEDTPELRLQGIIDGTMPTVKVTPQTACDDYTVDGVLQESPSGRDDLAAILHTSGSTGAPKAVGISPRNLSAFVAWCARAFPLASTDRVAALSPFHFDLCTHDIYVSLLAGAAIALPEPIEEFSPQKCFQFVRDRGITRLYMVPTFLERLAISGARRSATLPDVMTVMFAGERMTAGAREAVEKTFTRARLFNLYGPIETNVVTCQEFVRGALHDSSDIGQSVTGSELAILDGAGMIRAAGRGELVVSGDVVSPGYLDPDNTGKHFFDRAGIWHYRTGDEVTIATDGAVRLHGRLDNMVKVRGHRIELEDVEAAVSSVPDIRSSGVVVAADGLSITAYVEVNGNPDLCVEAARGSCSERLLPYMVPSRFRVLQELPTTSTGKVDRQALRRMESDSHG